MDLPTLRADARFLISKQLTATDYSDADCNRNINLAYKRILPWIINEEDSWQVSADEFTKDLKKDVIVYEAPTPTKLLRIIRAEAKLSNAGSYEYCRINDAQRNETFNEGNTTRSVDTAASPTLDFFGLDLILRPAPTEDVINGLKIWAQVSFLDLDDVVNNEPELAEPVHRAISVMAALDLATSLNMRQKIQQLNYMLYGNPNLRDDRGLKGDIITIYGNHAAAFRPRLNVRRIPFT